MKKYSLLQLLSLFAVLLMLTTSLSGCVNAGARTPEATPIPPTPEATATATTPPARIILLDATGTASEAVNTLLTEFAAANALTYEKWTTLDSNLTGVKVLVVFGAMDTLADSASSSPETQFIVVTDSPVTVSANLSIIQTKTVDLAFMAGYISILTAEDWRAGGMVVDTADAFQNGGKYFCGQCSPLYPPYNAPAFFPAVVAMANQSDAPAWSAQAAALLNDTNVNSVFIDKAGDAVEVLDIFTNATLYGNNPASANLSRYAAILGTDALPGLQQLLPEAVSGQGGKTVNTKVALIVINDETIVSPAKQALFAKVAQDLADGVINPLSVP